MKVHVYKVQLVTEKSEKLAREILAFEYSLSIIGQINTCFSTIIKASIVPTSPTKGGQTHQGKHKTSLRHAYAG